MSKTGYFRAIGTMTMGNLGKATIKVRHTYFSSTTISYFL